MKHTVRHLLALSGLLLGLTGPASAQMNYQGRLTDVNGDPIAGNQATIRFSLHDAETDGEKVWGDFDVNADLLEGRFNVVIGPNDTTSRSINEVFTEQLYLQITLFDDQDPPQPIVPALPRQQILNAPFALGAFNAKHAETADLATNATNADHATTATAVGDGNGTSAITLDGSKVGIGTPTPGAILEVAADSATDAFRVRVDGVVKLATDPNGGLAIGRFVVPPANGLYVEGASMLVGNVGVGTSSPGNKLSVAGNADFSGNVGIGTASPTAKLHINTPTNTTGLQITGTGSGAQSWQFNPTSNETLVLLRPGLRLAAFKSNGDTFLGSLNSDAGGNATLTVKGSQGNVGIGTNNPAVKLDVVGGYDLNDSDTWLTMVDNGYDSDHFTRNTVPVIDYYTWSKMKHSGGGGVEVYGMDGSYNLTPNNNVIAPVAIRAQGWIASSMGLAVYSDRRIKRDMQASATAGDLKAIQQLQVTDYRMVDPGRGGMAWRKGFIAQEVEKVIPGAVTRSTEFVPDVFSVATDLAFDPGTKSLTLSLTKDHGLTIGDRVRLHMDGKRVDLNVSAVPSAREFIVTDCPNKPEKVLVYGKQVNDFRTVDYDRVYTSAVGAVQELAKKLETKDAEIAALKQQLAAKSEKDAAQDKQLAALTRLLEPRAVPVSVSTVSTDR